MRLANFYLYSVVNLQKRRQQPPYYCSVITLFVLHTTVMTPVIRLIFACNRKKSFIRFSIDAQDEQGLKRQFCKKQISPFKRRKRVSRLPVTGKRDGKVSLTSYPVQKNRSFSLFLAPPLK